MCQVKKALTSPDYNPAVLAAGIDAPLFWSKTGHRKVDDVLEQAMKDTCFPTPEVGRIVQAVNSLQGACIAQGPLLAKYLRDDKSWKVLEITESHPKVLGHLLLRTEQPQWLMDMVENVVRGLTTHRRDATLCAVAAWAMLFHQRQNLPNWQNLYPRELHRVPLFGLDPPVSYWMPIPEHLRG